jgi:hypothetical protein
MTNQIQRIDETESSQIILLQLRYLYQHRIKSLLCRAFRTSSIRHSDRLQTQVNAYMKAGICKAPFDASSPSTELRSSFKMQMVSRFNDRLKAAEATSQLETDRLRKVSLGTSERLWRSTSPDLYPKRRSAAWFRQNLDAADARWNGLKRMIELRVSACCQDLKKDRRGLAISAGSLADKQIRRIEKDWPSQISIGRKSRLYYLSNPRRFQSIGCSLPHHVDQQGERDWSLATDRIRDLNKEIAALSMIWTRNNLGPKTDRPSLSKKFH